MTERNELLETTRDSFPDGITLWLTSGQIAYWNRAAESITGFTAAELLSRAAPDALKNLLKLPNDGKGSRHRITVHLQHKDTYSLLILVRTVAMRDSLGAIVGTSFIFHESDGIDDPLYSEDDGDKAIESSQVKLKEHLRAACMEFDQFGHPFGILWITIDQAHDLRRTHGESACDTMLGKMQQTILHGLRPGEGLGR